MAEHSAFARDRLGRLRRTLDMSYALVFGDLGTARATVHRMDSVHARVRGVLPEAVGRFPAGTLYDAMDPELRLWVHATLIDTSLVVGDSAQNVEHSPRAVKRQSPMSANVMYQKGYASQLGWAAAPNPRT